MTTKLPYNGYTEPLTESDTIIEVWQVDLMDLACAIHDDPEWQEFMRNGQKLTAEAT